MDAAQIRCPVRLTRLLAALTLALGWLTLLGLPRLGLLPDGWHAHVAQRGRRVLSVRRWSSSMHMGISRMPVCRVHHEVGMRQRHGAG